jgi:KDO2-lipid IV(A) lauroyltransferase
VRFKFAHDAAMLRRLAYLGARHGPRFWLKYSPPVFGVLFALGLPKHRRKVRDNLRWVRGPVSPWREQREIFTTFVRYAQCLAEALGTDRAEARQLVRRVSGEAHLLKALETGTGALLVTAHAGPWDAAAQLLRGVIKREVVTVMQSEPNAQARDFHDHVRGRGGVRVIHIGTHPTDALPLIHELGKGGIVAVQLDRAAPSGRGIEVQLFGRGMTFPEGPFRLASMSAVPILPMFVRRLGLYDYELIVNEPIRLPPRANAEQLATAAQQVADAMARFLSSSPTQWFHF